MKSRAVQDLSSESPKRGFAGSVLSIVCRKPALVDFFENHPSGHRAKVAAFIPISCIVQDMLKVCCIVNVSAWKSCSHGVKGT